MRKLFVSIVAAIVAVLTVAPGMASAPDVARRAGWMSAPCVTEDSVNCQWNAHTRGDGSGHSFYVRELPGRARMVCVFYVSARYARTHDYCTANPVLAGKR